MQQERRRVLAALGGGLTGGLAGCLEELDQSGAQPAADSAENLSGGNETANASDPDRLASAADSDAQQRIEELEAQVTTLQEERDQLQQDLTSVQEERDNWRSRANTRAGIVQTYVTDTYDIASENYQQGLEFRNEFESAWDNHNFRYGTYVGARAFAMFRMAFVTSGAVQRMLTHDNAKYSGGWNAVDEASELAFNQAEWAKKHVSAAADYAAGPDIRDDREPRVGDLGDVRQEIQSKEWTSPEEFRNQLKWNWNG